MNQQKLWKISLVIPIMLIVVGSITMYFYQFFLFSEKFVPTGYYFLMVFVPIVILLTFIPWSFLNEKIKKKSTKQFLLGVDLLISIASIVIIILGISLSSLYINTDHYNTGPILTWGTGQDPSSEITVMWRTSEPEQSIVYYGLDPNYLTENVTITELCEWHQVPLIGLFSNSTYYYQIGASNYIPKYLYYFKTAPIGDSEFSYLVFSDPRQNTSPLNVVLAPNVPEIMMQNIHAQGKNPAFTINCGDITTYANLNASWKSWFEDVTKSGMASTAALQIAAGNHERQFNDTGEIFEKFYPYSRDLMNAFSYSYNYSSLHVLVLDPWNHTIGGYFTAFTPSQLNWIEEDLKNAESMKYKIIALHPPIVYNDEPVEMFEPVVNLCDKYGVDVVFFGHDHSFDTSHINNTHYLLIGVGGNNFLGPTGYCQVEVTTNSMEVNMNWLNGTTQKLANVSGD